LCLGKIALALPELLLDPAALVGFGVAMPGGSPRHLVSHLGPPSEKAFSVADACATMTHKPEISATILAWKASEFKQLSGSWLR
jgi:hypothetical protein